MCCRLENGIVTRQPGSLSAGFLQGRLQNPFNPYTKYRATTDLSFSFQKIHLQLCCADRFVCQQKAFFLHTNKSGLRLPSSTFPSSVGKTQKTSKHRYLQTSQNTCCEPKVDISQVCFRTDMLWPCRRRQSSGGGTRSDTRDISIAARVAALHGEELGLIRSVQVCSFSELLEGVSAV